MYDSMVDSSGRSEIPRSISMTFAERLDDFVVREFDDLPVHSVPSFEELEI